MPTVYITNVTELQAMSADLAGVYQLSNNIDASATSGWNAGAGFIPVGNSGTPFTGSFNGAGYAITSITINRSDTDYQGLFGATNGATIQSVSLSGTVTGKRYTGGIVGSMNAGTFTKCVSTATVSGAGLVGGLIGNLAGGGAASNSYATGEITSSASGAGGAVGQNSVASTITNVYATGNVTGAAAGYVGGFLGYNAGGTIRGCFSCGTVGGSSTYIAPFIGRNTATTGSVGSLTLAQMIIPAQYIVAGWNLSSIWVMPTELYDLTGYTIAQASQVLAAFGISINDATYEYSLTVPAGQIISQSISAGGALALPQLRVFGLTSSPKTGDAVNVTVSLGDQVEVQNTLGLTQAAATSLLEADAFTVSVVETTSETVPTGYVISQDPEGGTLATYESEITITVAGQIEVPDVVGDALGSAIDTIESANLNVQLFADYSETVEFSFIISQDPAAGEFVDSGSEITITASIGTEYIKVPGVLGLSSAEATALIEGVGLTVLEIGAYDDLYPAGLICAQDPVAGFPVLPTSTVRINLSYGVEPSASPVASSTVSMADMIRTGVTWLGQKRASNCASQIVYKRDTDVISVYATYGKTSVEVADESGMTIIAKVWDFIIQSSELDFEPEAGDIIETDGQQYEVLSLGGEAWRWSDPYRSAYRIHTKNIGEQ